MNYISVEEVIINALISLLNLLMNIYAYLIRHIRIVNVRLSNTQSKERNGKKVWVFELSFTIRAPKGTTI